MESTEIHTIGTQIFTGFEHLVSETGLNQLPQHHSSLVTEEQKFRLWAYSLGLNRKGHSSLDYRVRDAVVMKESLVEVLTDLRQHMNALIDIALERRRPFEDEPDLQIQEDEGNSTSSESTTESVNESSSSSQSRGSFHEVDFRMHSIVARIDTLFILATKIRNPQTRQQRPLEQLFKNIPREQRSEHIEERERAEIMALAYLYRQEPRDDSHIEKDVPQGDESTPTCNYPAGSVEQPHWLIERIGCGNARRKQQFEFWKMHSTMPQKPVQEIPPMEVANLPDTHTFPDPMVPEASLATSVTKFIDRSKGTTDDHSEVRSTISYESRAPTSINPIRETLEWPEPPPVTSDGNPYFICPYCYLLCPIEYLAPKAWRTHLTYDLQPYQCTYQECNDSRRIYGSKREWIQHEAQHYKPIEEGPFVAIPVTECPRGDCPLCHKAFSDTAKLQRQPPGTLCVACASTNKRQGR
ncbi:hypothetical protein F4777DRAFT_48675 [Nemania sp. FL0916]|nr:hypothetical protein F4777DRAFT_48675 [Nemania sp. FL0916]